MARDAAQLAEAAIIILSLPTPAACRGVLTQLAPLLAGHHVVIETSTVNASDIHAEREIIGESGAHLMDAAIIGGVAGMYEGIATLLIGADDASLAMAQPALDALTPNRMRLGDVGTGMAAKVINNAVSHAVMVVLCEAFSLATATGVDPHLLVELLERPDAGLTRPLTHRIAERALTGDFDGGMPMQAARKDSTLALNLAKDTGVPLFAIQAAHTVYEIGLGKNLGRLDYAAIATLWQEWTGRGLITSPID